jgi:hypothetical protein
MAQRNYGCDGQIRLFFGSNTTVDLDATGETAFKGQTYQCQLVQAFVLKQVYEGRRAANQLGHLVWMLNEIWPTVGEQRRSDSCAQSYGLEPYFRVCLCVSAGWGSLEYGPPPGHTPGQLQGGRWKPVHYFYKRSLMVHMHGLSGNLCSTPQCVALPRAPITLT